MDFLIPLVLGWLLGLLGPPIVDRIRRRYRARDLETAILTALYEMRFTLANVVYRIRLQCGEIDHEVLRWLSPYFEEYRGADRDPKALAELRALLALDPPALKAANVDRYAQGTALSLKTYSLPLLEAYASELAILPPARLLQFVDIRSRLSLFNQQVTFIMGETQRASESAPDSRAAARKTVRTGYDDLVRRARNMTDSISALLRNFKPAA